MGGGVAAHEVDAAPYPQGEQGDEGKRRAEVEQAALAQVVLHLLLIRGEESHGILLLVDERRRSIGIALFLTYTRAVETTFPDRKPWIP